MDTYRKVNISAPDGWTLEYNREWIGPGTQTYADDRNQPKFGRGGTFAGGCTDYGGIHKIEMRSHYNGSGASAFGGARQWPTITSQIAFNEGEYELAAEFAHDLGAFIDSWLKGKGR